MSVNSVRLCREDMVLLIIDIQERLAAAMPENVLQQCEKNVAILCEMAKRLEIPVVVSEQYPKGLGATRTVIAESLTNATVHSLEKVEFSVCDNDGFSNVWNDLNRSQWVVAGMETHVCVYQSVRDLVDLGAQVHVLSDAVVSRTKRNWEIGLELTKNLGATISSTEVVLFDILQKATGEHFKALSKAIR